MMMDLGWGKVLASCCTYCHVPGKWEWMSKPAKQLQEECMDTTNGETIKLKTIKGLQSGQPLIQLRHLP